MTIELSSGMTRIPMDICPDGAIRRTAERRTEFVEGSTAHLPPDAHIETRERIALLAGELFDKRIQAYLATVASHETVNLA